jgi:hypothetical protein
LCEFGVDGSGEGGWYTGGDGEWSLWRLGAVMSNRAREMMLAGQGRYFGRRLEEYKAACGDPNEADRLAVRMVELCFLVHNKTGKPLVTILSMPVADVLALAGEEL